MFIKAALAALTAAALTIPGAAAAQQYYGRDNSGPYYGQPRGDYSGRWRGRFGGYPEFRGIEDHIRREIQQSVAEGLIERDDARDLLAELRDIQQEEARGFRAHGWNLPPDDRYRLRAQLQQLDEEVDEIRAEPED